MTKSRNVKTDELIDRLEPINAAKIPDIVSGLRKAGSVERDAWCDLLIGLGTASIHAVTELLGEQDDDIRWHAVHVLAEIDEESPTIVEALCRALSDDTEYIRLQAALGLAKHNSAADQAVPVLVDSLVFEFDDDEYDEQCDAAGTVLALGDFSPPTELAINTLIKALSFEWTRISAAEALAKLGVHAAPAEEKLNELLADVVVGSSKGDAISDDLRFERDALCIAVSSALVGICGTVSQTTENRLTDLLNCELTFMLHRPRAIEILTELNFNDRTAEVLRQIVAGNDPHLAGLADSALTRRTVSADDRSENEIDSE